MIGVHANRERWTEASVCALACFSQPKKQAAAGFTLMELLITIAVIMILAAILLPAISSIRASAMKTVCATHQGQFLVAIHAYCGENRGILPPLNYLNINKSGDDAGANYLLSFFSKDASITSGSYSVKGVDSFYAFDNLALRCPSWYKEWWKPMATDMGFYASFISLSGNALRNSQAATQFGFNGEFLDQSPMTRNGMLAKSHAAQSLIFCGNSYCNQSSLANTRGQGSAANFPVFPHRARNTASYGTCNSGGPIPTKPLTGPIDGYANIGFADGHVESRQPYRSPTLTMTAPNKVPLCTTAYPGGPTTADSEWGIFWYGR